MMMEICHMPACAVCKTSIFYVNFLLVNVKALNSYQLTKKCPSIVTKEFERLCKQKGENKK